MKKFRHDFESLNNSILPFLEKDKTYCIGLSGGSDSVLLLHSLHKLSLEHNFKIAALHLNHSLRGDESEGDATFCKEICKNLDIKFITKKVDIKKFAKNNKFSIEDAARKYRYRWFARTCKKLNADSIFIAHHADDQAETVLLRLFRGTGLKGLAGMKKTTFFGKLKIVRPWLNISRSILDDNIERMKLQFRYDSSNSDTHFDRNWLRHNLVPKLNEHFKSNIKGRLLRTAAISAEAYDFISQHAEETFYKHRRKSPLGNLFPLKVFKKLHPAVQNAVLMLMLETINSNQSQFSYKSITGLKMFALSDSLHCPQEFSGNISIGKAYNHLFIGQKKDFKINNIKITIDDTFLSKSGLVISIEQVEHREESISSNGEAWKELALGNKTEMIQYASIPKQSVFNIRSRKNGDRYTPINGKKSKIKNIFITAHIPQQLKAAIPIIELGNEIVWLSGWRIANKFKVPTIQPQTQNILIKLKISTIY